MCRLKPKRAPLVDLVVESGTDELAPDHWNSQALANLVWAGCIEEAKLHGAQIIFNGWLKWWSEQIVDEKNLPWHFLAKPTLPTELYKLLTDLLLLHKVSKR